MSRQLYTLVLILNMSQSMLVAGQFPWGSWAGSFSGLGPPCATTCADTTIKQQFTPFNCASSTDTSCLCSGYDNAGKVLGDIMSYCIKRDCPSPVHVAADAFYGLCNPTGTAAASASIPPFDYSTDTGLTGAFVPTVTPKPDINALAVASSNAAAAVSSGAAVVVSTSIDSAGSHVFFTAPVTAGGGAATPGQTGTASPASTAAAASSSAAIPNTAFIFTPGKIAGIAVGVVVGLILVFVLIGAAIAKYRSHRKRKPEGYYDGPPTLRAGPRFGAVSYRNGIPAYEKDLENAIHEKDVKGAPVHEAAAPVPADHLAAQEMAAHTPVAQEMAAAPRPGQYLPDLKFDGPDGRDPAAANGRDPFVTPEELEGSPGRDSRPRFPTPESPPPVPATHIPQTGVADDLQVPADDAAQQASRRSRLNSLRVLIPDQAKRDSTADAVPPYGPLPPIPAGQPRSAPAPDHLHLYYDHQQQQQQQQQQQEPHNTQQPDRSRRHRRAHTTGATNSSSSSSYVSPIVSPETEHRFPDRSVRGSLMRARPAWLHRHGSSASRRRVSQDVSLLGNMDPQQFNPVPSPRYTQATGLHAHDTIGPVPQRAHAQSMQRFLASDMRQVSPFQPDSDRAHQHHRQQTPMPPPPPSHTHPAAAAGQHSSGHVNNEAQQLLRMGLRHSTMTSYPHR